MSKKLSDIGKVKNGYAFKSSFYSKLGQYKIITISNVQKGNFLLEPSNKIIEIPKDIQPHQILKKDDILISLTGNVGRVCKVSADKCLLNQRVGLFQVNSEINKDYVYHQLNTRKFQLKMEQEGKGAAQKNLSVDDINNFEIFLPNSSEEQKNIADSLNFIEKTILLLEKKIKKKELIKQGSLQSLLSGKNRLPGFNNKWESKSMGELFKFSGGISISRDNLGNSGYLYLHYGDIHLSNKTFVNLEKEFNNLPRFDTDKVPKNKLLNHGDIVFVDASEDLDGVNKHWVVENPQNIPFIAGSHTLVAKNSTNMLDVDFTKYCFLLEKVKKQFQTYAVGTKVSGVNKTSIKKINLTFPVDLNEQKAIASILLAMDKELDNLNVKLEKLKLLKQGMEEQLLTGKIRLP